MNAPILFRKMLCCKLNLVADLLHRSHLSTGLSRDLSLSPRLSPRLSLIQRMLPALSSLFSHPLLTCFISYMSCDARAFSWMLCWSACSGWVRRALRGTRDVLISVWRGHVLVLRLALVTQSSDCFLLLHDAWGGCGGCGRAVKEDGGAPNKNIGVDSFDVQLARPISFDIELGRWKLRRTASSLSLTHSLVSNLHAFAGRLPLSHTHTIDLSLGGLGRTRFCSSGTSPTRTSTTTPQRLRRLRRLRCLSGMNTPMPHSVPLSAPASKHRPLFPLPYQPSPHSPQSLLCSMPVRKSDKK